MMTMISVQTAGSGYYIDWRGVMGADEWMDKINDIEDMLEDLMEVRDGRNAKKI